MAKKSSTESKPVATRIYRLRSRKNGGDGALEPAVLIEAKSQPAALLAYADRRVSIDVPSALEVAKEVRDGAEVFIAGGAS